MSPNNCFHRVWKNPSLAIVLVVLLLVNMLLLVGGLGGDPAHAQDQVAEGSKVTVIYTVPEISNNLNEPFNVIQANLTLGDPEVKTSTIPGVEDGKWEYSPAFWDDGIVFSQSYKGWVEIMKYNSDGTKTPIVPTAEQNNPGHKNGPPCQGVTSNGRPYIMYTTNPDKDWDDDEEGLCCINSKRMHSSPKNGYIFCYPSG